MICNRLSASMACLLAVIFAAGGMGAGDEGRPAATRKKVVPPAELTDDELKRTVAAGPGEGLEIEERRRYERALTEIIRRGGAEWEAFLEDHVQRDRAARAAFRAKHKFWLPKPDPAGLEPLTALRRLQKAPDPVAVVVSPDVAGGVECVFPALPAFPVALVNGDVEKERVVLTDGGDYRSGRQARWRFEVRDERGRTMPVREYLDSIGGGIFQLEAFAFGEEWKTELRMASFVPALPPGRYQVRIHYHNEMSISEMSDAGGLITCMSPPIDLVVAPAVVELTDERDREVRALVARLEEKRSVRIVAGRYGPWAHELVPPDSAQGRLLSMGLVAVPPLIAAMDDKALPAGRRAVVLSMLFSLTGENDPTYEDGVVGAYRRVDGPWHVWGGDGAGFGAGGTGWGGGTIDAEAQLRFAERWEPWKGYVRVRRPGAVD